MQRWAARYPVLEHDQLVGRMAVEAQPGQRLDQGKAAAGFQLALTLHLQPESSPSADDLAVFTPRRGPTQGGWDIEVEVGPKETLFWAQRRDDTMALHGSLDEHLDTIRAVLSNLESPA